MIDIVTKYQWELFISLEIISYLFLIVFLIMRYVFSKQRQSITFLILFILCILLEAGIALLVFQKTGEISTFQIIIAIFVIYACTFGIADFKKLDRFIKKWIGKWRNINLLTEEDIRKMKQAKDPKVTARKNRLWWYFHAVAFVVAHLLFWLYYGNHSHEFMYYLTDLSWWEDEGVERSPFQNDVILGVSKIWTLVFAIDTIISWSYTIFPDKKKRAES